MSSMKTDQSCSKFQANIFSKSRCQNCFKSRELHLMTSEEFDQAKPIYASWLCLAPEGTDFDNPMQRSRKWQRRFFILYEHGSLQFALDESPSTIPQGTVDLNLCTEVIDGEARTGQKNALCIITPEQELYIRGDSKEIIYGWNEQLTVFLQTNKQNQRKKRKVSSVQSQEQACEEAVCSIGASETGVAEGNEPCSPEQDDGPSTKTWANRRDQDGTNALATEYLGPENGEQLDVFHEMCRVETAESSHLPPRLCLSCPSPETWATECDPIPLDCSLPPSNSTFSSSTSSVDWELDEDTDSSASSHDGSFSLTQVIERDQTDQRHEECDSEDSCFTNSRVQDDYSTDERKGKMCQHCRRPGRSRSQTHIIQKEKSEGFLEVPQSSLRPLRRVRSLDGRASDSTMRPDLLNFKKGWLLSLNDHEQWRKYWFVLSAHSLRYYLDSGAEESSELVGEIDLTTCYQVTENQVQRNYGFQLHTHKQVYRLAAMTAGIRQNWIQALVKNIQNRNAPDVASLAENHFLQVEALCGPDVTQDSRSTKRCPEQQSSHNRRHEHGAKTFGWDEVGHSHMMEPDTSREQKWVDLQTEKEQESRSRRRGREERRQRYAIVMGSSACPKDESSSLGSPEHQQQQQKIREIEERWLQVERTAMRKGKKVPLYPNCESKSTVELEKLLEHYHKRVEQLTLRLTESTNENQSLEQELNADWSCREPTHDRGVQHKPPKTGSNKQNPVLTLTDKYQETKQLLQLENLRRQQIRNQLGLCPSAQFIKEPEIKNECNVDCEMTFNKSGLASHAWCEASRDWEDEHSRAEVDGFSERAALVVKENIGSDPTVVKRFSQEAEFLARQNEALKQHNQELLNQLAEANREIDRLKAELRHQPSSCQPELESVVEPLEVELSLNHEKLQEALNKLAEMEENLKDTQRALQLREATLRGLGFLTKDGEKISKISSQGETDRLCQSEIKLSELESQLAPSEQTRRELQNQNVLLRESELLNGHRIIEAEETIKTLQRELQPDTRSQWEGLVCLQQQLVQDGRKSREGIQHVVEERVRMRSSLLSKLLEVIKHIAGNEKQGSASELENTRLNPTMVRRLQLEKNIWESFVNALKDNPFQGVETLLWYGKIKLEEIRMYLSALSISTDSSMLFSLSKDSDPRISINMSLSSLDIIETHDGTIKDEKERTILLNEQLHLIWRSLKQHVKNRLTLLNHVASKLESSINERQCDICLQTNEVSLSAQDPVVSAGLDIFTEYLVGTLDVQKERTLPIFEPFGSNVTSVEVQTENHERVLEQNNNCEKTEANEETESTVSLKSRIKELEHLLSEGAKRLACLQQQHEEDKDRLKMDIVAVYEQGFTLLKESHQKLTEDLLIKHQQEQELLQEDKDRLLAEEAAATLTVIEAMKRAHCSELERVLQKANQEKSSGDASIAEILKNHSEELASVERELDVLSELYSQKCLECVHLAQALEAERKALQHCQHQNLALSTRNQELNNHLANEVIRLSTVAKDGTGQLVDDRQQYELEIMLRVKETEVIHLQQEISTLKNELESAKTNQRLAIERYQEIQTDHCMVKEKAEQQIEQLREHLRLAYEALAESMEKETFATSLNAGHHALLKS